ncbi:MAG: cysteine hydrolase [Deltaproteobacteria bacterium]|nr:cysteine hydrolase [Deltaproteobacteria bacterium]
MDWFVRRAFRSDFTYPADTTALLLVNAQRGFFAGEAGAKAVHALVDVAREHGWPVVHAPFESDLSMRFPTEAHVRLAAAEDRGAEAIVDAREGDILLEPNARLSAFSDTELEEALRARGLQRLVLAGPLAELRVDSTLRDGVQLDFHVTLAREACSTGPAIRDRELYERTWVRYAHQIVDLDQLTRRIPAKTG